MARNPALPTAIFVCRQCNRQARVPRNSVDGVECRTCEQSTTIDVETPEEYDRRVNYGFE